MSRRPYPKPQKFIPRNPSKYVGDVNQIIARSNLEFRYFQLCDTSNKIKKWNSEDWVVPYISPVDGKPHRYFVDLYIEKTDGKKFLIEIKPLSQTKPPRKTAKKRQKTLINEARTWAVNEAKWEYAEAFAKKHGMEFVIMTEKDL